MNKTLITAILIQVTCILFIQGCTFQGQRGTCKSVRDCPVLLERLKNRASDSSIKQYLLDAHRACSRQQSSGLGILILLCCPSSTTSNSFINRGSINRGSTSSMLSFSSVSSSPSSGGCGTFADDQDRIVGGVEASIGAWPWMAVFGKNGRNGKDFFCGGTLISDRHVLSAAHCFEDGVTPDFVRVGDHDLSTERDCDSIKCIPFGKMQEISVDRVILHPQFRQNCQGPCNDIAVIKLRSSAVEDGRYVQHICLPTNLQNDVDASLDELYAGLYGGIVAGWGKTKNRNSRGSNVLMQARLVLGNDDRCEKSIGSRRSYPVKESVLCAGDCSGGPPCKDTCFGDSGGPIMMSDKFKLRWYVVGVTSVGPSICGAPGRLGRYTNVNHFIGWIRQNMF